MKLLLDSSGSAALREFAEAMPEALANITAATEQLMAVYQSVADTLGVHEQDFVDMLTHIKTAQEDASEAIDTIPTMLNDTADRIDAYVARQSAAAYASHSTASSKAVHIDTPPVKKSASDRMSAYMNRHKYSANDKNQYMSDPEWIAINRDLKAEMGIQQTAQQRMADYLGSHNYGMGDRDKYTQDPEWQEINNDLQNE